MTFLATRTRFGRYVFAIGGNPEAADLGGINTRWIIVKIFIADGRAVRASARRSRSARLNAATNALGTLDELYVIAAAVIGGTSLAGGVGTIPGAMLGALVMQSLQSGMVLMGLDAPLQNIVVGVVLVLAVGSTRSTAGGRHEAERRHERHGRRPHPPRRDAQHLDLLRRHPRRRPLHRSISIPARWSACSATTAPASRR